MGDFLAWVKNDWFSLAQTVGIVGGLLFTGISCRQAAKAQQTGNLLAFAERHRTLWSESYLRPELHRIFKTELDLSAQPITTAEDVFLNVVCVHYEMGWRLARSADRNDLKPLAIDTRKFFALPLPRAVWEKTRNFRNPQFVRFVERALNNPSRAKTDQTASA
jgi:hypothetical protein